jgi:hypothetical protein
MAKVILWQSPNGWQISVTPKQERMADDAGVWPKDPKGAEYCEVLYGLHEGEPTYTDREWEALIESLRK